MLQRGDIYDTKKSCKGVFIYDEILLWKVISYKFFQVKKYFLIKK